METDDRLSEPTALGEAEAGNGSRGYHVLDDPIIYPVILAGVVLTTVLPLLLEQQLCLPLLNGLVIFPLFAWALRLGRPGRAVGLALFWVACQTVVVVSASLIIPDQAGLAIRQALEHRSETLAWIASGDGVAGSPGLWLPQQLRQAAVFAVATLLTGGLGGLILLATTLNMVNFVVADLIRQAGNLLLVLLFAWPIWSLVRLLAALIIGAVLAEPVAVLDLRPQWWGRWWAERRRLLAIGLGVLLLSFLLQLLLAPAWDDLLRLATDL